MSDKNAEIELASSPEDDEANKLLADLSEQSDKHFKHGEFVMRVLEAFLVFGAVLYVIRQLTGFIFIVLSALSLLALYFFCKWLYANLLLLLVKFLKFAIPFSRTNKFLIRYFPRDNFLTKNLPKILGDGMLGWFFRMIIAVSIYTLIISIIYHVADAISTLAF